MHLTQKSAMQRVVEPSPGRPDRRFAARELIHVWHLHFWRLGGEISFCGISAVVLCHRIGVSSFHSKNLHLSTLLFSRFSGEFGVFPMVGRSSPGARESGVQRQRSCRLPHRWTAAARRRGTCTLLLIVQPGVPKVIVQTRLCAAIFRQLCGLIKV